MRRFNGGCKPNEVAKYYNICAISSFILSSSFEPMPEELDEMSKFINLKKVVSISLSPFAAS